MDNLVADVDTCRWLLSLGIPEDRASLVYRSIDCNKDFLLDLPDIGISEYVPAFTPTDILCVLPTHFRRMSLCIDELADGSRCVCYSGSPFELTIFRASSFLESLIQCVRWLVSEGYSFVDSGRSASGWSVGKE